MGHSEYGSVLGPWVMELIRTQTQTILCPQEAKQNKIMMQWFQWRRERGGKSFCHISIVSGPVKQSGTQCDENTAFHLAHTPDNEFPRRLLSYLVSFSFLICTQVSIRRGDHPPVHVPCTHRTPARDKPRDWELRGTQRWARGWTCPLHCCYLVHIHHHTTRIQEQTQVVTIPWEECTTKLIKTLTLPELLTISLLCPPSTTRSSEDNIKFEICQLAEPST